MEAFDDVHGALDFAKKALGYNFDLKDFQRDSLIEILKGKDVFCSAPTGHGKSVIFELAPLAIWYMRNEGNVTKVDDVDTTVVIIQPLKALIEENVARLKSKELSAGYISDPAVASTIQKKKYMYVFGSPESFTGSHIDMFKYGLFADRVGLIVVDESHCIKKW